MELAKKRFENAVDKESANGVKIAPKTQKQKKQAL